MKFETHALTGNIATAGDTFSLLRLVSAGLGIGFAPEWRKDLPNRNFKLRPVRSVDLKTGLGVAWNKSDPTASRADIHRHCPITSATGQVRCRGLIGDRDR